MSGNLKQNEEGQKVAGGKRRDNDGLPTGKVSRERTLNITSGP